jgi:chromosome partitioning protein
MVRDARRQRRLIDGTRMDWIVVRNRLSTLGSRNKRLVGEGLHVLGTRLGFRAIDGLAERVIYREFFPRGLTALDPLDEATLGTRPSISHVTARTEVMGLIEALRLPLDARVSGGRRHGPNGSRRRKSRSTCTISWWRNRRGRTATPPRYCALRPSWPP